jgi:hypothetical protein
MFTIPAATAPKSFTVVVTMDLDGRDFPVTATFSDSIAAERHMTQEMRHVFCRRVACAELAVTVPGDYYNEDGSRIGATVVAPAHAPTAWDLLETAPDAQVVRCKLAYKAIAAGAWADATSFLRNAAREEGASAWALGASMRAELCAKYAEQQAAARA